jgi:hypothetical protein
MIIMGRGNWTPDHPARHHNPNTFRDQLYVEILDLDDEQHEDFIVDEAYDTLKEVIANCLPESFMRAEERRKQRWFGGGFAVDTAALFWNQQVLVVWDTQGETYHQGVGVVVNPEAYEHGYGGLAERAAADTFQRVKKALLEAYPGKVSVRTSAWTSAKLEAA